MTLASQIKMSVIGNLATAIDLVTAEANMTFEKSDTLATGTAADQADLLWSDQRTLSASSSEELDLSGSLTDALGATVVFARVKLIAIFAATANTNNLLVGGAAANALINWVSDATDEIIIRPGGMFLIFAPDATAYAVTAGTGDLLRVENSSGGTSVIYDIVVIGASA